MTIQTPKILLPGSTSSVTRRGTKVLFNLSGFCYFVRLQCQSREADLAYSWLLEVDRLHEGCACCYYYNATTKELSAVSLRSIRGQRGPADGFFIICKVGEVPARFGKCRLMTLSEKRSATEAAGVQIDKHVTGHPDSVAEHGDDRNGWHAEKIYDLQVLRDPSAGGLSALQQIQWLCVKMRLDVPTTVRKTQRLITLGLAVITENAFFLLTYLLDLMLSMLEKNRFSEKSKI